MTSLASPPGDSSSPGSPGGALVERSRRALARRGRASRLRQKPLGLVRLVVCLGSSLRHQAPPFGAVRNLAERRMATSNRWQAHVRLDALSYLKSSALNWRNLSAFQRR